MIDPFKDDRSVELLSGKDNALGSYRLWRKGDLYAAEAIGTEPSTQPTYEECIEWVSNLNPENITFKSINDLYNDFAGWTQDFISNWNVCYALQTYMEDFEA